MNIEDIVTKLEILKNNSYVKAFIWACGLVGAGLTFFVTYSEAYNYFEEYNKKGNTTETNPVFRKQSGKDSINILITRFEDHYSRDKGDCIGYAINYRIKVLSSRKKLPINVQYADSIKSPITSVDASMLAKKNNSDLIIYGRFRNKDDQCGSGKICFKTEAINLLEAAADSNNVNVNKDEEKYLDIQPDQIETGLFTLDTLSFDSWVQSLYVLKKRGNNYNRYINLYKLGLGSEDNYSKMNKYNERAYLNQTIGNYYDAILDYDSSYNTAEIIIKNFQEKNKHLPHTPGNAIEFVLTVQRMKAYSFKFLIAKFECYLNLRNRKKSLELINNEIKKL